MTQRTRMYVVLAVFGLLLLAHHPISLAEENEGGSNYVFHFEPTIVGSAVSGHSDKFRELFQIPDNVSGGIGALSFDQRCSGIQDFHVDATALSETDYKYGMQYRYKELMTINFGFRDFLMYSNDASRYYTMPPALSVLDRDLDVDRRDISFQFALHPAKAPQFSFAYERKNKFGDQLLLRRGQLDSFMFYNLPLTSDTYNKTDLYTFKLSHQLFGTNVGLSQILERFDSRVSVDQIQYNNSLGLYRRAGQQDRPEYRNATTHFSVDRTLGKNLFLVGQYWYRDMKSNSDYQALLFSPVTGRLEGVSGNRDTDGDADLTTHHVLMNINYLFRGYLSLFGGIRYLSADKDASSLDMRRDISGFIDLTEDDLGRVNEDTVSGVCGFKLTAIPRTTIDYEAKLDRSDVDYHQRVVSSRGFIDNFNYTTDASFDTTSHVVRLNFKPCRPVFFLGQYKYSKFDANYDDTVITSLGGYDGFIGDWDNQTDEFTAKTIITLCRSLNLSFKFVDRTVDYDISRENVSNVAQTDMRNYNATLTYTPIGNLFLSFMFNHQDIQADTRARENPRNVPYDLNVDSFLTTLNFLWNERLSFNGGFNYADGDGTTQNLGGNGALGRMPLNYILQSYSLGMNYKKSSRFNYQLKYMYADYSEDGNGGVDNFHAHVISGRVYLTF